MMCPLTLWIDSGGGVWWWWWWYIVVLIWCRIKRYSVRRERSLSVKKDSQIHLLYFIHIFVFVWIRLYIVYRREDERRKIERETRKKGSRDAVGDHCCHYKVTVTSSNSICQYSNSESKCSSHTTRAHARNYTFRINALRFQRRKLWLFFRVYLHQLLLCLSTKREVVGIQSSPNEKYAFHCSQVTHIASYR